MNKETLINISELLVILLIILFTILFMGFPVSYFFYSNCPEPFECPICEQCEVYEECSECPYSYEQEFEKCEKNLELERALSKIKCDDTELKDCQSSYEKFRALNLVMTDIASREYISIEEAEKNGGKKYNCYNFSKDFVKNWAGMGFYGNMIFGSTPQGRAKGSVGHTFVAVFIEPITGEFVKISDNYELEDREFYIK